MKFGQKSLKIGMLCGGMNVTKRVMSINVDGHPSRGQPKKRWEEHRLSINRPTV
jgi:hypothetical protein